MNNLDVNKLLLLLDQYNEKLTKLCVNINKKIRSIYIFNTLFLYCIFKIFYHEKYLLLFPVLSDALFFILISYCLFFNIKNTQNIISLKYRIITVKEILEKAIRYTSNVIEVNNIDEIKKMQLDFKLLMSEMLLERYFGKFDKFR